MWRPNDWHSPYEEYTMDEVGMKLQHEAYEAGADAMLEALKKDCVMSVRDVEALASAFKFVTPESTNKLRKVFILEEQSGDTSGQ